MEEDPYEGVPGPVEVSGISRRYGSVQALDTVSTSLTEGVTVLLGRNGAGKTTLCRIVVGLEEPDSGLVLRAGRLLRSPVEQRRHHAETGWLPQTFEVPKSMTVTQYLRYAAWLKGAAARRQGSLVAEALERTDLMAQRKRRLGQLSGGMVRRVGIAQAIVHRPSVLVLDEPSVGVVDVSADGSASPGALDLDSVDLSAHRAEQLWFEGLGRHTRAAWFTAHQDEIERGVLAWVAFRAARPE